MKETLGQHALEPTWCDGRRLRHAALPPVWRDWLLDKGSLTRRLQQCCDGRFHVELLSQGLERPMLSEARALGRPATELALVRQVRLHCDEQEWVFARTVIPLPSLNSGLRRLTRLGAKPLGAVLFADPRMQRGPIEITQIKPRHRLHRLAMPTGNEPLWGRRSVFILRDCPLLVSEFFMPPLDSKGDQP